MATPTKKAPTKKAAATKDAAREAQVRRSSDASASRARMMAAGDSRKAPKKVEKNDFGTAIEALPDDSLEGYDSGIGIVTDTRTAAELAEAEARNAGVSGQCVMRSAPGGYANGAGQEILLATDESDTYVVEGGTTEDPALAQVPGEDHPTRIDARYGPTKS